MKILTYLLFLLPSTVFANDPVTPATNTSCNSGILICETNTSHTFNNGGVATPCNTSYVYQYYYFFTSGGNITFEVSFALMMEGYILYGPLSFNLPDACEQINSNAVLPILGSGTSSNFYSINTTTNPGSGLYVLKLKIDQCDGGTISFNMISDNFSCAPEVPCENCIASFELVNDGLKRYIISAWTKEEGAAPEKTSYDLPVIELKFNNGTTNLSSFTFQPSGVIIDGWQRIEGEFTVPVSTNNMEINLKVVSGEAYFDDIRVFPFDGSMKSYVYDPITLRLMAELDERNYASIYEYDEEGKLVRVKKETERGVMTIQENKTFIKKE